ncbi:MAG: hypothetical protein U0O22_05550 [Acutalibacteraceae bacterium]
MSKLSVIKAKLAAILAQMSVVKTDKAILEYDGEDLKAGMGVYISNENGERTPAEDGEYTTEDDKIIVVKDGMVESITDPIAEVDGADEEPVEETPVEEIPAEEPKVEELEEPVAEEPKETTEDAIAKIREEINELYKLVDSILDKIGETRDEADARFKKLEQMSAAKPAEEVLEGSTEIKLTATSDKRAKRLEEMSKDWRKM